LTHQGNFKNSSPSEAQILDDHDPPTPLRRQFDRLDAAIDAETHRHKLIA
jgi:hypothetical protein